VAAKGLVLNTGPNSGVGLKKVIDDDKWSVLNSVMARRLSDEEIYY
jgi:hypothetical protein